MGEVIGAILPLALGIAISPIPIMGVILMLQSPRARATSLGFLGGWVLGIIAAIIVFELLSAVIPAGDPDAARPFAGVVEIVLGAGLLFLAYRQWRARPAPGEQASVPKWMAAVDTMTAARAFVLGLVLSAVNPKNLIMAVAAGVAIGTAMLPVGEVVVANVVFILLASSTVVLPVVAYLVAGERMRAPLERLHAWLQQNNATVMAIVLLVIGVVVIGKGIGSF